jgi:hypothetical protein
VVVVVAVPLVVVGGEVGEAGVEVVEQNHLISRRNGMTSTKRELATTTGLPQVADYPHLPLMIPATISC